ncbi:MAG TPA: DoxX family protein [Blastocatellia bacterium]|nr:DoxX family protein [Blastocatellia bacterium]
MQANDQSAPVPKKTPWAGIVVSALPALFLLLDGVMKLAKPAVVVETTVQLGYPESVILGLGIVLTACTIIYVIPRTAVLGAILLTGYLGGAVATHVRAGSGPFPVLFPVIIGALLWGGLFLRDQRLSKHLQTGIHSDSVSKKALWAGIIIGALPTLMLLFSGVLKLAKPAGVVTEFSRLGYPENVILGIGILEIACTVVYIIPRVSVLGAILLTGYLGGAVATHVRIGDPLSNVLGPVIFGVLLWGGLYLRDQRLRALLPLRS